MFYTILFCMKIYVLRLDAHTHTHIYYDIKLMNTLSDILLFTWNRKFNLLINYTLV